ncbi:dUTP diphosphatase [Phaeobacter inhibens]|uniref:dUTP diphosphatase n=1 Tax=Phaeobacter inhibens TaxID=221822 RepID=UPI000C9BF482|nr:dUTP diphosphatase [Phaeobacter inhibens]MDO6757359.1 dUTP diphosphatase [Phaeobacter inhibens]UWR68230.1 dUTP diphosphatase [Phaeobacter inhibens]
MGTQTVKFQFIDGADVGLGKPSKATEGSSGFDLRADLLRLSEASRELVVKPQESRLVPTGIRIAMPQRIEGQIRPRSGLAAKHNVTVLNAPGTIDCDYRGELQVLLINHGKDRFRIRHGDRIAQLVFVALPSISLELSQELAQTERGENGFGSTGVS